MVPRQPAQKIARKINPDKKRDPDTPPPSKAESGADTLGPSNLDQLLKKAVVEASAQDSTPEKAKVSEKGSVPAEEPATEDTNVTSEAPTWQQADFDLADSPANPTEQVTSTLGRTNLTSAEPDTSDVEMQGALHHLLV